jgi:DNA-directed RNA polymerase specialized sigma24 family protein
MARWAEALPALGPFRSPGELVRRCHRHDPAAVQAADALAATAGADPLAARTILAVLLPGLAALVRTRRDLVGDDREPFTSLAELDQFVLAVAWEHITEAATAPAGWRLSTVLRRTANKVRKHAAAHHRQCRRRVAFDEAMVPPSAPGRTHAEELVLALTDAVRRGVVTVRDARVIYATRVAGHSPREMAQVVSCDEYTLRRRRHRAERALAADALADVEPVSLVHA